MSPIYLKYYHFNMQSTLRTINRIIYLGRGIQSLEPCMYFVLKATFQVLSNHIPLAATVLDIITKSMGISPNYSQCACITLIVNFQLPEVPVV